MATFKLESGTVGSFKVNGKPYSKGQYELVVNGDQAGIRPIQQAGQLTWIAHPVIYSEWRNGADVPYPSIAALLLDIEALFFLDNAGAAIVYKYVAADFTDLNTVVAPPSTVPAIPIGTLAYVYASQGTQWLPGPVGGTYYPKGVYVYTGVLGNEWVSDRNNIAQALEGVIHIDIANEINSAPAKVLPTTADQLLIEDAADTFSKKKISIGNLPQAQPAAHASRHVTGGNDKIRDATPAQDGLMTAVQSSKLAGIETGAEVNPTNLEIQAAYDTVVAFVTQVEAEAGIVTTQRRWSPERVRQAIAAQTALRVNPIQFEPTALGAQALSADTNDFALDLTKPLSFITEVGAPPSRNLTGIVKPAANQYFMIDIVNAGATPLTLVNNSPASLAGNRLLLPTPTIALALLESIRLVYFGVFQIWVPVNYKV